VLLADNILDEISEFAENLSKQSRIKGMFAGMTAAHVVTLCAKVIGKCCLHWRHDVPVLAMSLERTLLWKNRANSDELERALLWIETTASYVTMQHIRGCLGP